MPNLLHNLGRFELLGCYAITAYHPILLYFNLTEYIEACSWKILNYSHLQCALMKVKKVFISVIFILIFTCCDYIIIIFQEAKGETSLLTIPTPLK